jgi:signal transduction histidine kinase
VTSPLRKLADELAGLRDRRTLMLGIVSGYALTACFAVLLVLAVATDVIHWHWAFGALIAAKLASNTASLITIDSERWSLEVAGVNTAMDAVVMTGAIWATGDTASPIVAIYSIEVTVLALLTNLAVTMLVAALCLVLYIAMGILTATGVLPRFPTPAEWHGRDAAYLSFAYLFVAFVIGAPTFYTARILQRLRRNERTLAAQTRALIDANRQKAQFMANMTHELRTPLQGIMGLSDLVAKNIYGETTEKQRNAMRDVKAGSKRLLGLIDDLLQLASHDAGKLEVRIVDVDLGELLPATVANTQFLLAGKELSIDLDVEPELPVLATDRGKLVHVLLDLITNAIKFTPDGGSVTVAAKRVGEGVEIAVTDTGVGIPAHQLERVFDEFHQVDGTLSREYGGVGLGLALARRLLGQIGGTITVASEVGRGSTFRVQLPITTTAASVA